MCTDCGALAPPDIRLPPEARPGTDYVLLCPACSLRRAKDPKTRAQVMVGAQSGKLSILCSEGDCLAYAAYSVNLPTRFDRERIGYLCGAHAAELRLRAEKQGLNLAGVLVVLVAESEVAHERAN